VVARRLARVGRIIAVTGGKGGIGKSSVAVGLALTLAGDGARAGLLDLDLWGPSDHVILGIPRPGLREDGGLVPDVVAGVTFMSIASIDSERPALLRGEDITNAILELLAVTIWGELDILVVDMPPGFGDTLLDAARYLPRAEYLVVTTPSELTLVTTRKMLGLLRRLGSPVLGLAMNLGDGRAADGRLGELSDDGTPLLGSIARDDGYEASLGDVDRLMGTQFIAGIRPLARRLREAPRSLSDAWMSTTTSRRPSSG
jgi:ATP-binding protein involved in chromosome partitioning